MVAFTVRNKIKKSFSPFYLFGFLCLFVFCAALIVLFAFALISSFKGLTDFVNNPIGLPEKWLFGNYALVFKYFKYKVGNTGPTYYVETMFLMGILYAVGCALAGTIVCAITAYAASRFKYRFSSFVYGIVIFAMIFPIIGSQPSELQLVRSLGLYDKFIGVFILKANFVSAGVYFMLLYAQFEAVPKSFYEAAQIDGASNLTVMLKIMFPLVRNTLFTIMLINFINYWNDYQTPLLYLPGKPTVALGLYDFSFSTRIEISNPAVKLGACMVVFVPVFAVFVAFHKRIIGNVSTGGIKG